jgi:hypothetical protein
MKVIELFIDEEGEFSGIDAISIVEQPAIEENFVALKEEIKVELADVDKEKRILMGAALVPNKKIYRRDKEDEYYIYFSEDTVRRASELFLMKGNQNRSTLEHQAQLSGMSVVESWIIEDEQYDKSRKYGLKMPVGTWMVSMKVNNEEVWKDYVKTGKVKGFSIEGYFTDKVAMSMIQKENDAAEILLEIADSIEAGKLNLKTYGDYGSGVRNNAKRGIELNKKVNNRCATSVGKIRAQQLARGEKLSVSTIKRMYSYLSRAETYYDAGDSKACGTISYLLWGGKAGLAWSRGKLRELGELDLSCDCTELSEELELGLYDKTYSDYPDAAKKNAKRALAYYDSNKPRCGTPQAWQFAQLISAGKPLSRCLISEMASYNRFEKKKGEPYNKGCGGLLWDAWGGEEGIRWAEGKLDEINANESKLDLSSKEIDGRLAYDTKEEALRIAEDIGCEGFHIHNVEDKDWYMPCKEHKLAEYDDKGRIKRSKKAPNSDTPNPNPKRGSNRNPKGAAGKSRGVTVPDRVLKSLQKKANDFNEKYKSKKGYGTTVGQLKSVYQRGVGAFQTSHSPNVKSAEQWAQARVNAYIYLLKNGRPQNAKYTTDYDLLPKKHPKSSKK